MSPPKRRESGGSPYFLTFLILSIIIVYVFQQAGDESLSPDTERKSPTAVAQKSIVKSSTPSVKVKEKVAVSVPTKTATPLPKTDAKAVQPKSGIWDVPFFSQYDSSAASSIVRAGCGPVSLAMILAYYGKIPTVKTNAWNVVWKAQSLGLWGTGGTSAYNMAKLARYYGLSASYSRTTLDGLKEALKKGPVITSSHTDGLLSKSGHLLVVVGINGNSVYTNDPATAGNRGKNRVYSLATFLAVWRHQGNDVVSFSS